MSFFKNKKLLSIALFVVPLAIGIPLALYLIPSKKIKNQNAGFDFMITQKDSVKIKLNILIKQVKQLNERVKKLEKDQTSSKDTLSKASRISQPKMQSEIIKKRKQPKQKISQIKNI